LFYGEMYNEMHGMPPAEFVHRRIFNGSSEAIAELNGPFAAFGWDENAGELIVVTDRLGRFPVFYATTTDLVIVTTDLHSVFNAGILVPQLREEAIAEFLTIGFPLGDDSMFFGVKRLSGGKIMTITRSGVGIREYWKHEFRNSHRSLDDVVEVFRERVSRTVNMPGNAVVTLSGGWDSRATCSALAGHEAPVHTVSYGAPGSADTEIGGTIARELRFEHSLISPENDFFDAFERRARDLIAMSNGHATIDLAFQTYVYERLSGQFDAVIDSAGCEFRRGVRARMAVRFATRTEDITRYLTTMYATGVWNEKLVRKEFVHHHETCTFDRLTRWLGTFPAGRFAEKIDAFSTDELWAHHYAHGYPLQTGIIGCRMPFSDNIFYDAFSSAEDDVRWSHLLHRTVIRKYASELEKIPISYGSCKVPYGESVIRFVPILYHQAVAKLASRPFLRSMRSLDNYKPFRPYHIWYTRELEEYVNDTLHSLSAGTYLNPQGIRELLKDQKEGKRDASHSVSVLLTLAHLLDYERTLRSPLLTSKNLPHLMCHC